jgi:uncharacterized protein YciI
MKTFVYFYLMKNEPEQILQKVQSHVLYWKERDLTDYRGGPFSDRSGGLIMFSAKDLENVNASVAGDPFIQNDLIDRMWIKEWCPE